MEEEGGKKKKKKMKRLSRFMGKPKQKIGEKEVSHFSFSFPSSFSFPHLPSQYFVDTASEMTDAVDTTLCTSMAEDGKEKGQGFVFYISSVSFSKITIQ